jgi:hypothetical protein
MSGNCKRTALERTISNKPKRRSEMSEVKSKSNEEQINGLLEQPLTLEQLEHVTGGRIANARANATVVVEGGVPPTQPGEPSFIAAFENAFRAAAGVR